jgi:hypothetical protein
VRHRMSGEVTGENEPLEGDEKAWHGSHCEQVVCCFKMSILLFSIRAHFTANLKACFGERL